MENLHTPATAAYSLTGGEKAYMFIKSSLDFIISLLALIVLALPMVILALIIKLDDRGPVFFKQKRIGKDQKYFMMLKFRTMRTDTPKDTATHLLTDPQKYITKVGRFLRKTSLDELPQLINILCGHMSIVGPRPALWNQFDLIEEREKYGVHQVRPGLTGWAQVNGRDELEIPVKAKLDGEYIEKFGLMMDIRCFFATFGILDGKGVVEGGTGELHRQEQEKK
jgi:O-antigen biosynthesis protein WbqP